MTRTYPHLSSPIQLGRVTFRNRMFAAPTGATDITWDCCAGPGSRAFYENRAKGGSANVTVSELVVHPETDASHMLHLELQTPGSLASFTMTADAIRRHGAIPSVELSHSGQYAGTYLVDKNKKASLSQYGPCDGTRPDGRPVKALTKEQIADIVASYGEKAALAKRAGFEMVMIHAGHGWLINQFLSPYFNKRTDEYGGDLAGRARLLLEVVASVRAAVGEGFPIEVRMSGSELFEGGYTLDEGIEIAKLLDGKVELIHVSAGSYQFGFFDTHPPMFSEHGCNVYLAAEIKKHVSTPVATVGGTIGLGETQSYLFYRDGTYGEYGAVELTEEEFNALQGAQDLMAGIEHALRFKEAERMECRYFLRANGILQIQCDLHAAEGGVEYGFFTARCQDGAVDPAPMGSFVGGQLESPLTSLDVVY